MHCFYCVQRFINFTTTIVWWYDIKFFGEEKGFDMIPLRNYFLLVTYILYLVRFAPTLSILVWVCITVYVFSYIYIQIVIVLIKNYIIIFSLIWDNCFVDFFFPFMLCFCLVVPLLLHCNFIYKVLIFLVFNLLLTWVKFHSLSLKQ